MTAVLYLVACSQRLQLLGEGGKDSALLVLHRSMSACSGRAGCMPHRSANGCCVVVDVIADEYAIAFWLRCALI